MPLTAQQQNPSGQRSRDILNPSLRPPDKVNVVIAVWRSVPPDLAKSSSGALIHVGNLTFALDQAPLTDQQEIRIDLTCSRPGFLYVFSQERYADNTLSDPYLFFPSARVRGAANDLQAGSTVQLPGRDDHPPYFVISKGRANQTAELLSVLLTVRPLPGVSPGQGRQAFSKTQLESWKQQASVGALDAVSRPKAIEQPAEAQMSYTVVARPDQPVFIQVPLVFR